MLLRLLLNLTMSETHIALDVSGRQTACKHCQWLAVSQICHWSELLENAVGGDAGMLQPQQLLI
jgi:hypothetical protein